MSENYDNWERLVAAVLRREQLWQLCHQPSRSSSINSEASDVSFSFRSRVDAPFGDPQRVRVQQYRKSFKELTALYKSQEIQAHNGSILKIEFSLDGQYLASAGEDSVIHVWQVVGTESEEKFFSHESRDVNINLIFLDNGSPEPALLSQSLDGISENKGRGRSFIGRRKAVGLEQIMVPETLFSLSQKPICSFEGHSSEVLDLSWSKAQQLLSSSTDKTVRLWDLSSKDCLKIFSHNNYVVSSHFNPVDDRYFISGCIDGKVRIWSIADCQVIDYIDLHAIVTAACYTPDGEGVLVGTLRGSCLLYRVSDTNLQLVAHMNLQAKRSITGFQFAPGSISEVLMTSSDSRIRVIDGVDLLREFSGFHNKNSQIAASLTSNGKYVVSASEDSYVYVWRNEVESRPSRSRAITSTESYERFNCQDVSAAIPWPGLVDAGGSRDTFAKQQDDSAWGMVIVTAGFRGEIRAFQNFGLPTRVV